MRGLYTLLLLGCTKKELIIYNLSSLNNHDNNVSKKNDFEFFLEVLQNKSKLINQTSLKPNVSRYS